MRKIFLFLFLSVVFISCNKQDLDNPADSMTQNEFVSAVDISRYPEIANTNPIFYNQSGNQQNIYEILRNNGVNTIRLRLWVNPSTGHSTLNEVLQFSQTLRNFGFKIWLCLHYSDTWADPGQQQTPVLWQGLDLTSLKDRVYNYTEDVMRKIQPEYVQIGNEINAGFLHPTGDISSHPAQFLMLLQSGITAVRDVTSDSKIILHYAGIEHADWFFNQVSSLDYDIIGLSYYPIWHGKSLGNLRLKMQELSSTHNKEILIAETAYPFTLGWNDWTNNIVGLEEQLILPDFPASTQGQQSYIREIKRITRETTKGIGFCYWGATSIAWKGNQATDASPWENQALFDFQNKAVPALSEFKIE